jgi:hypothetical protein
MFAKVFKDLKRGLGSSVQLSSNLAFLVALNKKMRSSNFRWFRIEERVFKEKRRPRSFSYLTSCPN